MNLLRLSGRKVCERVKSKGMMWKGKHFHARYLSGLPRTLKPDAPAGLYTGVVTSTALDKSAVKRNRMRRRCREALRLTLKEIAAKNGDKNSVISTTFQLLLLPRSSSLSAPFGELLDDARRLLFSLTK